MTRKERNRLYYQEHKQEILERALEWQKNPCNNEKHLASCKFYREKGRKKENSCTSAETRRRMSKDWRSIENFEEAYKEGFNGWDIHHRLETHTSDGHLRRVALSKEELIALDFYYDIPSKYLIYLKHSDHLSLHNKFYKKNLKKYQLKESFYEQH